MNTRGFTLCMLFAVSSAALPLTAVAACDARSGSKTAALVDLYTSEGCSSCPPADQQLSRLRQTLDPAAEVVPLALRADATARAGADPAALYLALAESGLVTKVTRGENGGVTLAHDHVVREWIGPIRLAGGAAQAQREIALPAVWNRARLEVVAFVQDERSGSVLQALSAQHCAGS
jgi:hypothetical protein